MTTESSRNHPRAGLNRSGMLRPGVYYDRSFVSKPVREEILKWLSTIHPLWEERYSVHNPPPPGQLQRQLLRPVYWLGNWQFACLDYYHPPKGIWNRCVRAEPFPPALGRLVAKIEALARREYRGKDMPPGWHLNTCLLNFYGNRVENGKRIDTARVGDTRTSSRGLSHRSRSVNARFSSSFQAAVPGAVRA